MTTPTRSYLTLLAGVVAVGLLLIGGLSLAIYYAVTDHPSTTAATDGVPAADTALAVGVRDRIAAAPMLPTTPADATGGTPALGALPEITIPLVAEIGPVGIPAGYPHTPEGAVGQLGEILVSVLGSMDLAHAQRVQEVWFEDPTAAGVYRVHGWFVLLRCRCLSVRATRGFRRARLHFSLLLVRSIVELMGDDLSRNTT